MMTWTKGGLETQPETLDKYFPCTSATVSDVAKQLISSGGLTLLLRDDVVRTLVKLMSL